MDTLSHGLWAVAVAKGVKLKSTKKIKLGWMALWGIFPDIFSFIPVIVWILWLMFYKGVDFSDIPRPETMPPEVRNAFFVFRLTDVLYHISHSFIIFFALFFLTWIICWYKFTRKQKSEINTLENAHHQKSHYTPYWEMTGWFIHIITDIPTHSSIFYPTLFLCPLSDWCFNGTSWGNMQFIITNYASLLIVFILLRFVKKAKGKRNV